MFFPTRIPSRHAYEAPSSMARYDREILSCSTTFRPLPQTGRWKMVSGKSWKWSLAVPEYRYLDCPILYRPWMGTARNTPYPIALKALGLKSGRYCVMVSRGAYAAISILDDWMSVPCRESLFGLQD